MYDEDEANAFTDYTMEKNLLGRVISKEKERLNPCKDCEGNRDLAEHKVPECACGCIKYRHYKIEINKFIREARATFRKELTILAYEAEREGYKIDY